MTTPSAAVTIVQAPVLAGRAPSAPRVTRTGQATFPKGNVALLVASALRTKARFTPAASVKRRCTIRCVPSCSTWRWKQEHGDRLWVSPPGSLLRRQMMSARDRLPHESPKPPGRGVTNLAAGGLLEDESHDQRICHDSTPS
jgi:hypothetical protein